MTTRDEILTPEVLNEVKGQIEAARLDLLCANDAHVSPLAEQYVLIALDTLSQGIRFLMLAKYALMQKR